MSGPKLIRAGIKELLPQGHLRSSGDHVSEIIRYLCVTQGLFEDREGPPNQALLELGLAFEDVVAESLASRISRDEGHRYLHNVELELDGIYGTVDLIDTTDWIVEEVKLTRMSSKQDVEGSKFWRYWAQLKAYTHMLRMAGGGLWNRGVAIGRLHVCFINGDYRGGGGPQYFVWEDTWSDRELADNWNMIKGHRRSCR